MATYYVSKNGSDNNNGTTTGTAFATIQKAANIANPGDTVNVMAGTYNEAVTIRRGGSSGNVVTFQNYSSDEVWIDGYHSLPHGPVAKTVPPAAPRNVGVTRTDAPLVHIRDCSYVTWDGINIKRSYGRGIQAAQLNSPCTNIKIKNCTIDSSYGQSVSLWYADTVELDGLWINNGGCFAPYARSAGTPEFVNWPGSISCAGAKTVTVTDCTISNNWGEAILFDSNEHGSDGLVMTDNVIYDNFASVSFHAGKNILFERNYIYRSNDDKKAQWRRTPTTGIVIVPTEKADMPDINTENIVIRNNIIVEPWIAFSIRKGGVASRSIKDVEIYNNTVINPFSNNNVTMPAFDFRSLSNSGIKIRNNIIWRDNATGGLTDTLDRVGNVTFSNNYWSHSPDSAYDGTSDVVSSSDPFVDSGHAPDAGEGDPTRYNLVSGSGAVDAGATLSGFTTDYNGSTRSGTWDIGAWERGGLAAGNPSFSAALTASDDTPTAGTSINFTWTGTGGTGTLTYELDPGDGRAAYTSATSPTAHTYEAAGVYTARIVVTDANGLTAESTEIVTVSSEGTSGGTSGADNVEVVAFDAGDASFTVSGAPVGILFIGSGATANGTERADAQISVGVWAGGTQYTFTTFDENGQNTTDAASQAISDKVLAWGDDNAVEVYSGAVSSVTSSAVNMTWSGTATAYKCVALVFYGSGPSAGAHSVTLDSSSVATGGNYDFLIAPTIAWPLDSNIGNSRVSLGIATATDQAAAGFVSRNNQSATDARAQIHTDAIAVRELYDAEVVASGVGGSQFTLSTSDSETSGQDYTVLGVKFNSAAVDLQVVDLPTGTGNTDFDFDFDPQAAIGIITNLTATDTASASSAGGALGIFVSDGTTTQSVWIRTEDGASPSDAGSYTNNDFRVVLDDGTVDAIGTVSMVSGAVRINFTDAPSDAYKMILLGIEEAGTTGPTPEFDIYSDIEPDGNGAYTTDATLTVANLTNDNGTTPSAEVVDWGDGTTDNITSTVFHSYGTPGTYRITLTVTESGVDYEAWRVIEVVWPYPEAGFTVSDDEINLGESVTFTDTSTTYADDDMYIWTIRSGDRWGYSQNFYTQGSLTWTPDAVGTYDVVLLIQRQSQYRQVLDTYFVESAVTVAPDFEVDFYADQFGTLVGTQNVTFTPILNLPTDAEGESVTYEWDFDFIANPGTDTSSDETPTNSFTTGTYSVKLTVTVDGWEASKQKDGYITIVAAPTAPYTQSELVALWDVVKEHIGAIDATWVAEGTANVWEVEIADREWMDGYRPAMYRGSTPLTQTDDASTATSGTYYYEYTSGTLTIGVYSETDPTAACYRFVPDIPYLLLDEFTDTLSAGSVDGTDATPGPGTRSVTDTDGIITVGSGAVTIGTISTVDNNTHGVLWDATARADGRTLIMDMSGVVASKVWGCGWHKTGTLGTGNYSIQADLGVYAAFSALGAVVDNSAIDCGTPADSAFAFVLGSTGGMVLANSGGGWSLLWRDTSGSTATLYPWFASRNNDDLSAARMAVCDDFPASAMTTVDTSPVSGSDYTATADLLADLTVTMPSPLAGTAELRFRKQDAANYWTAYFDSAGAFKVDEVASGTPTNKINVAGVATAGNTYTIRVRTRGTTIEAYTLSGTAWTDHGSTTDSTLTAQTTISAVADGSFTSGGGSLDNLEAWNRDVTGSALSWLNARTS